MDLFIRGGAVFINRGNGLPPSGLGYPGNFIPPSDAPLCVMESGSIDTYNQYCWQECPPASPYEALSARRMCVPVTMRGAGGSNLQASKHKPCPCLQSKGVSPHLVACECAMQGAGRTCMSLYCKHIKILVEVMARSCWSGRLHKHKWLCMLREQANQAHSSSRSLFKYAMLRWFIKALLLTLLRTASKPPCAPTTKVHHHATHELPSLVVHWLTLVQLDFALQAAMSQQRTWGLVAPTLWRLARGLSKAWWPRLAAVGPLLLPHLHEHSAL